MPVMLAVRVEVVLPFTEAMLPPEAGPNPAKIGLLVPLLVTLAVAETWRLLACVKATLTVPAAVYPLRSRVAGLVPLVILPDSVPAFWNSKSSLVLPPIRLAMLEKFTLPSTVPEFAPVICQAFARLGPVSVVPLPVALMVTLHVETLITVLPRTTGGFSPGSPRRCRCLCRGWHWQSSST